MLNMCNMKSITIVKKYNGVEDRKTVTPNVYRYTVHNP